MRCSEFMRRDQYPASSYLRGSGLHYPIYGCSAMSFSSAVILFIITLLPDFSILTVFFSLFKKYYFHRSSTLTTFPISRYFPFCLFLITFIMAGDFMMYSVSFIKLYSSKEIITTLALPDRCTNKGSLSFVTPSR